MKESILTKIRMNFIDCFLNLLFGKRDGLTEQIKDELIGCGE